ncbi:MAG: hypothetical protein K0S37_1847 [Microbacterium sp.]|jgi:hypothetical protein|nr:hypothetical protein [Microbacterium sp.]
MRAIDPLGVLKEGGVALCDSACRLDSDVLLADWEATGHRSMRADVCVPGVRGGASAGGRELSSMVVLDVFRLGALLVAHRQLGIAPEWRFVLKAFDLKWEGPSPLVPALGAIWCELTVEASIELARRERSLLTWRCAIVEDGRTVATGRLQGWLMAPRRYRAHRKALATKTSDARTSPPRRLLAADGDGWQIHWDGRDAVQSAARLDHIPPLVLAEAALSATRLRSPEAQVDLIEMTFPGFAEREAALKLELAWDAAAGANAFAVRQGEHTVATARVHLLGRAPLHDA